MKPQTRNDAPKLEQSSNALGRSHSERHSRHPLVGIPRSSRGNLSKFRPSARSGVNRRGEINLIVAECAQADADIDRAVGGEIGIGIDRLRVDRGNVEALVEIGEADALRDRAVVLDVVETIPSSDQFS